MGPATNVNSFNAKYDMLKPTTVAAKNVDVHAREQQDANSDTGEDKQLGDTSTVTNTDTSRQALLTGTGLAETGELQTAAQAEVDRSAWAITAEGDVNTVAYGDVLRAKRPVEVRGAGLQFSGTYYVEQVLHTFNGDGYTQHFSLRRNAAGVTNSDNFVDDGALPS
jgi:hypothetical protein